jgi:kynurenine formamidase
MLTNLDQVPEAGAMVIVSFPKAGGAPNFPARVPAICPA